MINTGLGTTVSSFRPQSNKRTASKHHQATKRLINHTRNRTSMTVNSGKESNQKVYKAMDGGPPVSRQTRLNDLKGKRNIVKNEALLTQV